VVLVVGVIVVSVLVIVDGDLVIVVGEKLTDKKKINSN
jgi:hypothetical protein